MREVLIALGLVAAGALIFRLGYIAGGNAAFRQAIQSINRLFPTLPKRD